MQVFLTIGTDNTVTGFGDIFKRRFAEGFNVQVHELTLPNVLLNLAFAFIVGMFIYFVYRRT